MKEKIINLHKTRKFLLAIVFTIIALAAVSSIVSARSSTVNGDTFYHNSAYDNTIIYRGVDVSNWQGKNIKWTSVKKTGVDFAFIRCGFGYSNPNKFSLNKDASFETNMKNAKAAGVQLGVYYYSTATTVAESTKEANYVLSLLKSYDIQLPVMLDMEDPYTSGKCSKTTLANISKNFCSIIDAAGYKSGVYASLYWFNNKIGDVSGLNKWVAQFYKQCDYTKPYEFWQCSSTRKVSGISGNVDYNFWYYDNSKEVTKAGTRNIKNADITLSYTYGKYTGNLKTPTVTVNYNGTTLTKGISYEVYYLKNVNRGTAYAMIRGKGKYSNVALKKFYIKSYPTVSTTYTSYFRAKNSSPFTIAGAKTTSGAKLTFSSSDKSIATVSSTGKVTLTGKQGIVKITVTSPSTSTYFSGSKVVTLTVGNLMPTFSSGNTSYRLYYRRNSTVNLDVKTNSDGKVTYTSSNTSVATVDSNGNIKVQGVLGSTNITVKIAGTTRYVEYIKTIPITTVKYTPTLTTSASTYHKYYGNSSFSLGAKTTSGAALSFKSSNTGIATVSSTGRVTLKGGYGVAKITVTSPSTTAYYSRTKTVKICVHPKKLSVTHLYRLGDSRFRVYWNTDSKVSGYQIKYSTSKYFKGNVTTKYANKSYRSLKIKVMRPNNYYYVKVRSYKIVDGTKRYSPYSTYKYIYVKK